jgi:hypothetical protein
MKAEQRHRLEQNALAERVGKVVQSVKSAPATQSLALWLGLAAVVIVIIAWQFFRSASYIESSALWRTLSSATRGGEDVIRSLEGLRDDHPGTTVGTAAGFQLARLDFQEGQANLGNSLEFDRKAAIKKLVSVRAKYAQLAKDSADSPLQLQEAMLMQAKIDESLTGVADPDKPTEMLGSLAQAKEGYQALATKFPESAAGQIAKKRLEVLDRDKAQIQTFYTDFNELLTKAPLPPGPVTTPPLPNFPAAPKLPFESTPPTGKPAGETPPAVKPGDFKVPPATPSKPADGKTGAADEKGKIPTVPALPSTPAGSKTGAETPGDKKAAESAKPKADDSSKTPPAADKKK